MGRSTTRIVLHICFFRDNTPVVLKTPILKKKTKRFTHA